MDLDMNEFGRAGYNFLRENKAIPDKDKKDLTFEESKKIVDNLRDMLIACVNNPNHDIDKNKYNFMGYLYMSVICYIDNTDLNKYAKISKKS